VLTISGVTRDAHGRLKHYRSNGGRGGVRLCSVGTVWRPSKRAPWCFTWSTAGGADPALVGQSASARQRRVAGHVNERTCGVPIVNQGECPRGRRLSGRQLRPADVQGEVLRHLLRVRCWSAPPGDSTSMGCSCRGRSRRAFASAVRPGRNIVPEHWSKSGATRIPNCMKTG